MRLRHAAPAQQTTSYGHGARGDVLAGVPRGRGGAGEAGAGVGAAHCRPLIFITAYCSSSPALSPATHRSYADCSTLTGPPNPGRRLSSEPARTSCLQRARSAVAVVPQPHCLARHRSRAPHREAACPSPRWLRGFPRRKASRARRPRSTERERVRESDGHGAERGSAQAQVAARNGLEHKARESFMDNGFALAGGVLAEQ